MAVQVGNHFLILLKYDGFLPVALVFAAMALCSPMYWNAASAIATAYSVDNAQ